MLANLFSTDKRTFYPQTIRCRIRIYSFTMKASYVFVISGIPALASPTVSQSSDVLSVTRDVCPDFPETCAEGLAESVQRLTAGVANKDMARVQSAARMYAERLKTKPECKQPLIQCAKQMNAYGSSEIFERASSPILGLLLPLLQALLPIVSGIFN